MFYYFYRLLLSSCVCHDDDDHASHCAVISQIPNEWFFRYRLNCP